MKKRSDPSRTGILPAFLPYLLLTVTGLIIYFNSLGGEFVFDDVTNISLSNTVRNLSDFTGIWNTYHLRFIPYFTFNLNYFLSGLDVTGYHLANLLIHISVSFLVYSFVLLLFRTPKFPQTMKGMAGKISLITALLFLIHPIQTEAVSYITQRITSIAALFYLLSMIFYLKYRRSNKIGAYILSFLSASMAFFSKENTFTLAGVLFLLDISFFPFSGKDIAREFRRILPFLFLPLVLTFFSYTGLSKRIVYDPGKEISPPQYFMTQLSVIPTYLRLLVLPVNQNLDYDFPVTRSFGGSTTIISSIFLIAIWLYAFWTFRRNRLIFFGAGFFFLALLVESSVIPLADVIFEHRLYLPSLGFFLAIIGSTVTASEKIRKIIGEEKAGYLKYIGKAGFILIVILLGAATWGRNNIWKDNYTLWTDTLRKSPGKVRPHLNLGHAYMNAGKYDEAIKQYRIGYSLNPKDYWIRLNIGWAYLKQRNIDLAIEEYKDVLSEQPDDNVFRSNLAGLYLNQGEPEKSIRESQLILRKDPSYINAYKNLGAAYFKQGKYDEAIPQFLQALRLNPYDTNANNFLGAAYEKIGDLTSARKYYSLAQKYKDKDTLIERE